MRLLLMIVSIQAVLPTAAHGEEVLRLQPSTKWVLEYADDSCRLSRGFGGGDERISLVLDQFVPGEEFKVMLIGPLAQPRTGEVHIEGGFRFGPNEPEAEITATAATTDGVPTILVDGHLRVAPLTDAEEAAQKEADRRGIEFIPAPVGEAREAAATSLEITKLLRKRMVLDTGPMGEPLAALRKCAWDTVGHWGLNVEQQKALMRRPVVEPSSRPWFRDGDYPGSMIDGGYQGIVNFRLMIDAFGKPTSCHVQWSSRPKAFDDVVCRGLMRRARFKPALDAQGKPVPSYWGQTVNFRLDSSRSIRGR